MEKTASVLSWDHYQPCKEKTDKQDPFGQDQGIHKLLVYDERRINENDHKLRR